MSQMCLIGVAGGSCTGKTLLCQQVEERLGVGDCLILSMDAYYRDLSHIPPEKRDERNFDIPEALDHSLMIEHLRILCSGGAVNVPTYNFATHTRSEETRRVSADGGIVLLEGLFALYWKEIRKLLSVMVFIDLDQETCLARRIKRDVKERGRTREDVEQQFRETVLPMYALHVAPTQRYADLVLPGDTSVDELGDQVLAVISEIQSPYGGCRCGKPHS